MSSVSPGGSTIKLVAVVAIGALAFSQISDLLGVPVTLFIYALTGLYFLSLG